MNRVTNNAGIDLAAAVALATDEYSYDQRKNYISVTTLIKPLRQIILPLRIPAADRIPDIVDGIQSWMGNSLHSSVEWAWKERYAQSLAKLGFPKRVIESIRINPEKIEPDTIPVFTEQRSEKEIAGWIVGGQVDLIIDFRLRDVKSTSVYGYLSQKGIETSWKLQGSIYRWLNQEKIQHDEFLVQYILRDWTRAFAKRDPNYPPHAVPNRTIQMMSVHETEKYLKDKLGLIAQYIGAPEEDLPECTEADLWRTKPKFKYYANDKALPGSRSTKNFDVQREAMEHLANAGKGRVDRVPGEVKACHFCAAFPLCSQKDRLAAEGSLILE